MNDNMLWIVLSIASAFFASLVTIFAKISLNGIDSTLATTVRTFVMFILLFVISMSTNKLSLIKTIDSRTMIYIVLAAIFGAFSWLAYFLALKYGPASRVYALDRLSIVFVVIFAAFIGEIITWQKLFGAFILTLGAIIIALC